jgi:hypothetical protein
MTVALAIGALQTFRIRAGIVTDYGADIFGTAWLYGMFRQGRTVFQRGRGLRADTTTLLVFIGCAVSELGQLVDLIPGVFDPLDLLAYGASVLLCYAVDRRFDLGDTRC